MPRSKDLLIAEMFTNCGACCGAVLTNSNADIACHLRRPCAALTLHKAALQNPVVAAKVTPEVLRRETRQQNCRVVIRWQSCFRKRRRRWCQRPSRIRKFRKNIATIRYLKGRAVCLI